MSTSDPFLDQPRRDQLHKRMTLNLLIQGAAAHTYVTAHHMVADQLEAIQPGIVRLYDKLAVNLHLSQWLGDMFLFLGRPKKFWRRIGEPDHPFYGHAFLTKHGPRLSRESWQKTVRRARQKGTSSIPGIHYAETFWLLGRTVVKERQHRSQLEQLGVDTTARIWGIEPERLHGTLSGDVEFGNLQLPTTRQGRMLRSAAAGYGGVRRRNDHFQVVARAWIWPLLAHELTKGTAELVCLHGLNRLDDETYRLVTAEADRIEHEIWMIQAGGELWRKFLAAVPRTDEGTSQLAESLMRVALLEPARLELLMMDLVEHPATARGTVADLVEGHWSG